MGSLPFDLVSGQFGPASYRILWHQITTFVMPYFCHIFFRFHCIRCLSPPRLRLIPKILDFPSHFLKINMFAPTKIPAVHFLYIGSVCLLAIIRWIEIFLIQVKWAPILSKPVSISVEEDADDKSSPQSPPRSPPCLFLCLLPLSVFYFCCPNHFCLKLYFLKSRTSFLLGRLFNNTNECE